MLTLYITVMIINTSILSLIPFVCKKSSFCFVFQINISFVLKNLFMSVGAHGADRVFVTAGDSLSLNCSATSLDGNSSQHHSDVIWLLNDVPVSNNSELLLTELSHTHHGSNLSCVAGTELVVAAVIAVVHRKSGKN